MFWKTSSSTNREKDGDSFTRRVHTLFAIFLFTLGILSGLKQYFGNPINCWMPSQFTATMASYANSYCYFSKNYYVFFDVPPISPIKTYTNFYKWTPFVLIFIAIIYKLPCIYAHLTQKIVARTVQSITTMSAQVSHSDKESLEAAAEQLVLELETRRRTRLETLRTSHFRRYLDRIWPSLPMCFRLQQLVSKLAYIFSSVFVTAFLYSYLKVDLNVYDQLTGTNTTRHNDTLFPKVIMCDFSIRQLQSIQRFTIQCHLPTNELFEKMALLVCYVSLVVYSVSSGDFVCSLLNNPFSRYYPYAKGHMKFDRDLDTELFKSFCEHYLRKDGMYLIWLIGQNSCDLIVSRVLELLWSNYKKSLFDVKPCLPHVTTLLGSHQDYVGGNLGKEETL